LEQIRQSTPPYISGAFPDAPSQTKDMTPPQPIAPATITTPMNMPNVFQVTQQQPAPVSTPKIVPPPVLAPLIAAALPTQPPVQFSPTPEPQPTPIQTPVQAMPVQNVTPSIPETPAAPITPVVPAEPISLTPQPLAARVAFTQPAPTPLVPTPATTLQPPVPSQSPVSSQSSQNIAKDPTTSQAISTSFQGQASQMKQNDVPQTIPAPLTPVWPTAVTLAPTKEVVPQPRPIVVPAPVQAMPVQNMTPPISVPVTPPAIPIIPAAFVPPAQFTSPSMPQQIQQAQPVTPPATSIFEQKMSGAFVVKSDVPNYSGFTPAPTVPQPQTPTMSPVPPPQNPTPAAQTGDAYREPIA
jgi:hypothetical protein